MRPMQYPGYMIISSVSDLEGSKDEFGDRLEGIAIELAGLSRKFDALALAPGYAAGTSIHIVRKGENVLSIARKYGMPIKVLYVRNGITASEVIQPGRSFFFNNTMPHAHSL